MSRKPRESAGRRPRFSLFARIYATLVFVIVAFVGVTSVVVWMLAARFSGAWSQEIGDQLFEERERIIAAVEAGDGMRPALKSLSNELSDEFDAKVRVMPGWSEDAGAARGRGRDRKRARWRSPSADTKLDHELDGESDLDAEESADEHDSADEFDSSPPWHDQNGEGLRRFPEQKWRAHRGPVVPPRLSRHERGLLTRGQYAMRVRARRPPTMLWPALDDRGRVAAVVIVDAPAPGPGLAWLSGLLFLSVLAGGTWWLARSLTTRLSALERSTRELAAGELAHRAVVPDGVPRDEIDRLAFAFNDMAQRIEDLLRGQRRLLTNVSHELKTPLARIRVLVEMLGERAANWDLTGDPQLARVSRGLRDMVDDLDEIEKLVQDLLTSGRLELGESAVLRYTDVDLCKLCRRAASRVGATVECSEPTRIEADELLVERCVVNLLGNARRACPAGAVALSVTGEHDSVVVRVRDEGPGVPEHAREMIFDPFTRLDAARDRSRGGIGLGLFLCRQIVESHGGSIRVCERDDGHGGAQFEVTLPVRAPRADA